jgi:hypothetical protein
MLLAPDSISKLARANACGRIATLTPRRSGVRVVVRLPRILPSKRIAGNPDLCPSPSKAPAVQAGEESTTNVEFTALAGLLGSDRGPVVSELPVNRGVIAITSHKPTSGNSSWKAGGRMTDCQSASSIRLVKEGYCRRRSGRSQPFRGRLSRCRSGSESTDNDDASRLAPISIRASVGSIGLNTACRFSHMVRTFARPR